MAVTVIPGKQLGGPDKTLARDQAQALRHMFNVYGIDYCCQQLIWILKKAPEDDDPQPIGNWNRRLVPFSPNSIQVKYHDERKTRNIVLKPRQIGMTTDHIITRLFIPAILEAGTAGLLISQTNGYGAQHFVILQRAHSYFAKVEPFDDAHPRNLLWRQLQENLLHTKYSRRREIVFDMLDSRVLVDSAEKEEVGQGLPGISHLVCCLAPETVFITSDYRYLRFEELRVGDTIPDSSGGTTKVNWSGYIQACDHPYKGNAFRIYIGVNRSIVGSPNHEVLTMNGMRRLDSIQEGDYLSIVKKRFRGTKKDVDIPELTSPRPQGGGRQPKKVGNTELDRELGYAIGFYLADGAGNEGKIQYCLGTKRKAKQFVDRIQPRLSTLFDSVSDGRYCYGKATSSWIINEFGKTIGKKVPEWVWDCTEDFGLGLLEGWLSGDGSDGTGIGPRQIRGVGVLPGLLHGMQDIARALGIGGVRVTDPIPSKFGDKKTKDRYELHFHGVCYDRIAKLLDYKMPSGNPYQPYTSRFRPQSAPKYWKEDETHLYFKVRRVEVTKVERFFDIEVDAIDHLYCLPDVVTHNTETARWPRNPEETMANVKESVHQGGTVDIESTANMLGGYFYEEYMRAKNDKNSEFTAHFFQWWHMEEYKRKPATPEDDLTEEEQELKRKFTLDLEQITWRRQKIISLRGAFPEKYPEDDISCFLLSGQPFFDAQALRMRAMELADFSPYMSSDDGTMHFYHRRIKGRRYVIGADPARGIIINNQDVDRSAAVCLDEETGEEVASFCDRLPPEEFGIALMEMAKTYNNALIAMERTGDGTTAMLQMDLEGYGNLYRHREWLKEERKVIEVLGWPPTTITRPIACNRLALFVRENPELIFDLDFIAEAYSFQRNGNDGKPAGSEGTHDDRVSCRYIAHYVRLVQLGYLDPVQMKRERYGSATEAEV